MKARSGLAPRLSALLATSLAAAAAAHGQVEDPDPAAAAPAAERPAAESPAASPAAESSVPPPASPGAATVDDLRRARDAFLGVQDFAAALEPAQQVVQRVDGTGDERLAEDVARLARIQSELEDFETAELNYLKAIDLIVEDEGEFSITLLEPYRGLGRSYIQSRRFPEAITALEQAQHISQRQLGLYNVSQTILIDDLTTAHLGMGDTITARELQLDRLENALRRFGEDSPQTIPFRYALATYYDQSRMREAAREQYEHVVELLEGGEGASVEPLLEPLRRLTRLELLLGDDDSARAKLRGLLDTHPDIAPAERALSLAALGDAAIVAEDVPTAHARYLEAYELLRDLPDVRHDELLAGPQMLDFIAPLSPVDRGSRSRSTYAWGEIVVEFDVAADGRASNVETVAATPAGLMDAAYARRIRETHFRPRLVDGRPQPASGIRFTHNFRYYVDEDDEE